MTKTKRQMKKSNRDMIRMAMMAILCFMLCCCRTTHSATTEIMADEATKLTIDETCKGISIEDMHHLIREKEDWHIVWYDNGSEPDQETGKKAISAEAWAIKQKDSQEERNTSEMTEEARHEETLQKKHDEEKIEKETSLKTGMEWWQTMACAACAMMFVLLMTAIRKATEK